VTEELIWSICTVRGGKPEAAAAEANRCSAGDDGSTAVAIEDLVGEVVASGVVVVVAVSVE